MTAALSDALQDIPESHRVPLITLYTEALTEYQAGHWEAAGLKVGKLCEVTFSILHGKIYGSFAPRPGKPDNMYDACTKLQQKTGSAGRSLCIQIPRVLIALYELRNNRAIGHVGGDVDPNHMDAELFIRGAKWIVSELVRVFAQMSTTEVGHLIEAVTARNYQAVWSDGTNKRVLNSRLPAKDKALLLLYVAGKPTAIKTLQEWSQYKNSSDFKHKIIKSLDDQSLIHVASDIATLLPSGIQYVEQQGLLNATPTTAG